MTVEAVTVMVVDDHPLYREAVVRALKSRPDLKYVGEAGDGRTALEKIRELKPDVCLLDYNIPELDGAKVLNALVRDGSQTRVVFLSGSMDSSIVYAAIEGGAAGFLNKTTVASKICDAVAAVARGEVVLPSEASSGLAEQIRLRREDDRPLLTPREHEILQLVAEGRSVPQIAQLLHLSPGTVKTHLRHIYDRFGVPDRAAAVAYAMRKGILE